MKVLVTGHNGYIGSVLAPFLVKAGHDVVGLDTCFYETSTMGTPEPAGPAWRADIRDIDGDKLRGFDAIVHLAALSNDPLGNLNSDLTYDINHRASVRLANLAREAGVSRFVFASSCSLYGAAGSGLLTENAAFAPITAYGESKVLVERDVAPMATRDFSPTFLRNATAYGFSPRLRADLMVNNLVGHALTSGRVLVESDGTPWRPLVHVEDIARSVVAVLEAPREAVHGQAFNVGSSEENYQVRQVAQIVAEELPGSTVEYAKGGGPDPRCYRVDCSKIAAAVPEFRPQWTVRQGVRQLVTAYRRFGLDQAEWLGPKYYRLKRIEALLATGQLDVNLRWIGAAAPGAIS